VCIDSQSLPVLQTSLSLSTENTVIQSSAVIGSIVAITVLRGILMMDSVGFNNLQNKQFHVLLTLYQADLFPAV